MRTLIKHIVGKTYRPLLEKYLSATRVYRQKGLRLLIPAEVFHPAFFTSTKMLLKEIETLELKDKHFLELGAGSGMIAMVAAKNGAIVTASELNLTAIRYLKINAASNKLPVRIIGSDVFENIPVQQFDIIAVNPPYYLKDPLSDKELAWYCGKNGEFFQRFFGCLDQYCHPLTKILMVLCDGCDLDMIASQASKNNWTMKRIKTKKTIIESSFVYEIKPCVELE